MEFGLIGQSVQHSIQHQHHGMNFDRLRADTFLQGMGFGLIERSVQHSIQHLHWYNMVDHNLDYTFL